MRKLTSEYSILEIQVQERVGEFQAMSLYADRNYCKRTPTGALYIIFVLWLATGLS